MEDTIRKSIVARIEQATKAKVKTYAEDSSAFKKLNRTPVGFSHFVDGDVIFFPPEGDCWISAPISEGGDDVAQILCEVRREGWQPFSTQAFLGSFKKAVFPEEGGYRESVVRDKNGLRVALNQSLIEEACRALSGTSGKWYKVTVHREPKCRVKKWGSNEVEVKPQEWYDFDEVSEPTK